MGCYLAAVLRKTIRASARGIKELKQQLVFAFRRWVRSEEHTSELQSRPTTTLFRSCGALQALGEEVAGGRHETGEYAAPEARGEGNGKQFPKWGVIWPLYYGKPSEHRQEE